MPRPPVPLEPPPAPPLIPSDSLTAWLRYWLNEIVEREVRPRTAETYRSLMTKYAEPSIGAMKLTEIQPPHIRAFHQYMRDVGRAESTVRQGHRVLAVALKQAHRDGYTHRDAAALTKPPRAGQPQLATLPISDARLILRGSRCERLGSRWAAALLTGARQGELLGLEIDRVGDALDLSWQLQRLTWQHGCGGRCDWLRGSDCPDRRITAPADYESRHIVGGFWLTRPKSIAGRRVVPLVEPLRTQIRERIEVAQQEPNPFGLLWTDTITRRSIPEVTGKPIDPSKDNKSWHALLKRVGAAPVRLHDARHLTVDLMYEAGVPEVVAMELIGHSSVAMTRRYRSGATSATMLDAMERMARHLVAD